ncbi:MAG: Metacaspase [Candidatus Ozemobacter sibiricus]|uniref:Metacaspase n=1 Tax=Candidatus Ozemobacter sibiricus TaxID=2268124 RepID=A0A367ZQA1_9BACT|nr:MAG: Metacaspase [Candidatus Ozemobacter sibiricus]
MSHPKLVPTRQMVALLATALVVVASGWWSAPAEAARPKKALLVGIGNYPHPPSRLLGPVADCRAIQTILRSDRFGFKPEDIRTLFDEQATYENILRGIAEHLIRGTGPGDLAVFYYSGHGTYITDTNQDEPDGRDEALCPYDLQPTGENYLIDDLLRRYFRLLHDRELVVILDCCHSGSTHRALGGPQGTPKYLRAALPNPAIPRNQAEQFGPRRFGLREEDGRDSNPRQIYFGASRDIETALEVDMGSPPTRRGVFTTALEAGLAGPADQDGDQIITYGELFRFVRDHISRGGFAQIPQCDPSPEGPTVPILNQPFLGHTTAAAGGGASSAAPPPPAVEPAAPAVRPVNAEILSVEIEGIQTEAAREAFARLPFVRLANPVAVPDVTIQIRKDGPDLQGKVLDSSRLVIETATAPAMAGLVARLGPTLEARFLQKKLAHLTVPASDFKASLRLLNASTPVRKGEKVQFEFTVSHDCHVYLVDIQPDGTVNLLFPNPFQKDNFVKAGTHRLPAPGARYHFKVGGPFGRELVKLIAASDAEAARRLGLPVPDTGFVSKAGDPGAPRSAARDLVFEVVEQVGEVASGPQHPLALAEVIYQTQP